ncbi:MAG TPA: DoxX family protein [Candidatus Polarisedimenticolaceae bacterium]|nr:DoxX family protein [Candidatus Polarisedimenticolaceae bacterium]
MNVLGRISSALAVLFLGGDAMAKLLRLAPVVAGTTQLGYPEGSVLVIGILEALCVVAYVAPPTAVLGALLLTGYLGGAIATHLRMGNPLFSHILFPVYVAGFVWGGLLLREARLRSLLPLRAGR